MTDGLLELGISQAGALLRTGEISSRDLTRACLRQIETSDGLLHAFLTLTPEEALFRANRADFFFQQIRRGNHTEPLTPLLGIPLAIKDVLSLSGVRCTCGSRMLENYIPPFTAAAVDNVIEDGAVILGKTNTDEFAMGSSTENSAFGPSRNPWNPDHVPGGSSGGSAAAVASGMALGALGTDTGGSVRQPAAYCGITGLKPTYGRVSRWGLIAYGSSLDSVGCFAHSAEDAAILFETIAGFDPRDATSQDIPRPEINLDQVDGLQGLKIGIPQEYFIAGIQPDVEQAVRNTLHTFEALGVELVPISMPHTEYALPVYYIIAPAEASANLARYDSVRYGHYHAMPGYIEQYKHSRGEGFGPEVKRRIMLGTYALSAGYYDAYYGQAQKVRSLIRQDFDRAFTQVDAIAAPVAPTTAFKIGEHATDPLSMYLGDIFTLPANLAGVPGIAFPVGFDCNKLPIGMQLMGRHFQEELLLRMTHAYQRETNHHRLKPNAGIR
ncbi:MAG: Asp-tRNA(Asn)/Glu-tRNA(Gln) amidotransferase GatCAB subunit A [Anaerolinea sp.]|nr:Asp-tRNA(Asn)/Glu-tRNA(Gln) amidotransferase GatCAB subunit A [Anaerolinea sp.]